AHGTPAPRTRPARLPRSGPNPTPNRQAPAGGSGSTQVPLSTVTRLVEKPVALSVNHIGQFPAATISFNLAPGVALGSAVAAIEAAERDLGVPVSVRTSFQGAASAFRASLTNELLLILAAIVTMYIVLGVLYESFIHPAT